MYLQKFTHFVANLTDTVTMIKSEIALIKDLVISIVHYQIGFNSRQRNHSGHFLENVSRHALKIKRRS